jgi:hypothetical protein
MERIAIREHKRPESRVVAVWIASSERGAHLLPRARAAHGVAEPLDNVIVQHANTVRRQVDGATGVVRQSRPDVRDAVSARLHRAGSHEVCWRLVLREMIGYAD